MAWWCKEPGHQQSKVLTKLVSIIPVSPPERLSTLLHTKVGQQGFWIYVVLRLHRGVSWAAFHWCDWNPIGHQPSTKPLTLVVQSGNILIFYHLGWVQLRQEQRQIIKITNFDMMEDHVKIKQKQLELEYGILDNMTDWQYLTQSVGYLLIDAK